MESKKEKTNWRKEKGRLSKASNNQFSRFNKPLNHMELSELTKGSYLTRILAMLIIIGAISCLIFFGGYFK